MNAFGIVLAAALAAGAFLYQKAWERRERRLAKYEAVMDALPGLMVHGLDSEKIEQILGQLRHLWLSAPPSVVRAFNELLMTAHTGQVADDDTRQKALAKFVLAARTDASLRRAFVPAREQQPLLPVDIKLMRANS